MAPKCAQGQLPKAAAEFKALIEAQNGAGKVGKKDIANASYDTRNKLMVAMKKQLSSEAGEAYKVLPDDDARHAFIVEYLLDPKQKTMKATNTIARIGESGTKGTVVWVTQEELAGPSYMNSAANAKIAIQGMPSKPHPNPSLASAGVLVYKHAIVKEVSKKTTRESAELEATVDDVDQETYDKIYKHMQNSGNPGQEETRPHKKAKKDGQKAIMDKESTPEKVAWKARLFV